MKKYYFFGVALICLVILIKLVGFGGTSREIPTIMVERGPFTVALAENGRLQAKRSVTVSAPRIRGGLQIVKLVDEGKIVKKGDFLVQFDPTEQETKLRDAESELKIAQANLEKSNAQIEIDLKQLELDLKKAERTFTEKQSEAPAIRKEAELELEVAKLNFQTKKQMLEADIRKMQVEVDKARESKESAERDLAKMTLTAPIPGLVVYLEIWKGGSMSKIQEGDAPWGGQGLIELPDLSEMVVKTTVSEVDVSKVKDGLKVEISLDAIPGPVFTGTVNDISTLARTKDRNSLINVFDIEVLVDSTDGRLKPGMSAKVSIIVEQQDDVLSVPLEAVFERDDTTVVYNRGGDKIPVTLGERNDYAVIVTEGIKEGFEICLVDPTQKVLDLSADNQQQKKGGGKKGAQSSYMEIVID